MEKKKSYEINDLSNFTKYYVTSWEQGKDETDKSAIKLAMEFDDVITMGKIIASPVR